MKRFLIAVIVFCVLILSVGCVHSRSNTPLQWCVLEVLHNEPYKDGAAVDSYKCETLSLPEHETEYYDEQCFIITVIYENPDGNVQFDYWYCFIAIKQRCVHDLFDYFRNKKGANAIVCADCVAIIDCDWFKTEIIEN